jgi:diguanylate cyclase (GGDEF)-like protein
MAQSLTRVHLQVFLILLLCFGAAGYTGYLAVLDLQQSSYQENATQTARAASDRISEVLMHQRQMLEKIAGQPGVASLLQRGAAADRERKEDEFKSTLPGAMAVRLIPRNGDGALHFIEDLDPVCLNFIRRVSMANTPVAPEFHAIGKPSEHYDIAVPVTNENRKPAGYLLASFARAPLLSAIAQALPPGGYMELQQAMAGDQWQTVIALGQVTSAETASVVSAPGNSRWTLLYQSGEIPPAILSGNRIYYLAFILFVFLVIIVVLFRLYRQTINAVRHDIRSLIRMFRDLREGGVRVDYPMALHEFAEIFDYLRDRGQRLVEEKQKLKDMGLMDHLSQLGNRRHFEERLKELFEASKSNGPSSVLMIDMDHFKKVNDVHGHDAGDALIVGFANALRKVVRQTDVLVRLGGDEFCIIYAYAPLAKATTLVERLRKQLPREILLTKGVMHQLRWTGGLSTMYDKDTKPDDVLWRADQALLQAKESGRNITKVYDPAAGALEKKRVIVS